MYRLDLPVEREGTAFFIGVRHRGAEIDAHVERLRRGEGGRHGAPDGQRGHLLAVDRIDTSAGAMGFGDCSVVRTSMRCLPAARGSAVRTA